MDDNGVRQDQRRDRCGRVDLPEQGGVQHPRRQLLAPHGCREPLLARSAERGGREAVELSGVVVVAAAGNYGKADGPERRELRPRQQPVRDHGRQRWTSAARPESSNDTRAPWSAYGRTPDGFMKPEICAPGRYMVGPIPTGSTLAIQKADKILGSGYIELSGTSFAAPVISGIAAQVLARHPGLDAGPGQGRTHASSSRRCRRRAPMSCGVGQVNAASSRCWSTGAPNPNAALSRFVKPGGRRSGWCSTRCPGPTSPGATSPGMQSPGPTSPGATSPGMQSPGATSPGRTCPGATSPGAMSPGRTEPTARVSSTATGYELTPAEGLAAAADPDLATSGRVAARRRAPR